MNEVIDAYCTLGTERDTQLTATDLLHLMNEAGIQRAIVAPEDREIVAHNASGNNRMVEASRQSQGRFTPACSVNPWFGESACQELRRAVAEGAKMLVLAPALQGFCFGDDLLDDLLAKVCAASGGRMIPFCTVNPYRKETAVGEFRRCVEVLNMRGLKIHPWVQGASLNGDTMDELCEMAAEWKIPLLFHDGTPCYSLPSQMALLARRHPATTMILGHCGAIAWACQLAAVIGAGLRADHGT